MVILMIYINPIQSVLAQPLLKWLPAFDRAYPKIPRRRRGKRCLWVSCVRVESTFRTIPTVAILRGESFSFLPELL